MYGYIYKTTNLINGKIYIGQHKAQKFEPNRYIGSGLLLKEAIDKYGKENFQCELLEWCKDLKSLNQQEKYWIEYFQSQDLDKGYNLTSGGDGNYELSETSRQKISLKVTGKVRSEESKLKSSNSLKKVIHTKEWISKISKARKGSKMPETCLPHSIEATKGTKWYNNGELEDRFLPDTVPEGWVKGRLADIKFPDYVFSTRDMNMIVQASTKATRNTKWYNNGIEEIRFKIEDVIPEGFIPGRLKFKRNQ